MLSRDFEYAQQFLIDNTETPYAETQRSFLGDLGSAAYRGIIGAGELVSGIGKTVTGDYSKGTVDSFLEERKKDTFAKPDIDQYLEKDGLLKQFILGAVESTPSSILGTGATLGLAATGVGIPASIALGTLVSAATMGPGTYGKVKADDLAAGLDEATASRHALSDSLWEVGSEIPGTVVGMKGMSSLFKSSVKQLADAGLDTTVKNLAKSISGKEGIKQIAKNVLATTGFEGGAEGITGYQQAKNYNEAYGLTEGMPGYQDPTDSAIQGFGAGMIMGTVFGGATASMNAFERSRLKAGLQSSDKEVQAIAAQKVYDNLDGEEAKKQWRTYSSAVLADQGLAFNLDDKFIELGQNIKLHENSTYVTPDLIIKGGDALKTAIDNELKSKEYPTVFGGKPLVQTDNSTLKGELEQQRLTESFLAPPKEEVITPVVESAPTRRTYQESGNLMDYTPMDYLNDIYKEIDNARREANKPSIEQIPPTQGEISARVKLRAKIAAKNLAPVTPQIGTTVEATEKPVEPQGVVEATNVLPAAKKSTVEPLVTPSTTTQEASTTLLPQESMKVTAPIIEDTAQKNFDNFMEKTAKKLAAESQGQGILDDMDELGESPAEVAKEFWNNTFWKLPADAQKKASALFKGHTGRTIADLREEDPLDYIDLPDSVEYLEGTDRGFTSFMKYANDRVSKQTQQPTSPNVKPLESTLPETNITQTPNVTTSVVPTSTPETTTSPIVESVSETPVNTETLKETTEEIIPDKWYKVESKILKRDLAEKSPYVNRIPSKQSIANFITREGIAKEDINLNEILSTLAEMTDEEFSLYSDTKPETPVEKKPPVIRRYKAGEKKAGVTTGDVQEAPVTTKPERTEQDITKAIKTHENTIEELKPQIENLYERYSYEEDDNVKEGIVSRIKELNDKVDRTKGFLEYEKIQLSKLTAPEKSTETYKPEYDKVTVAKLQEENTPTTGNMEGALDEFFDDGIAEEVDEEGFTETDKVDIVGDVDTDTLHKMKGTPGGMHWWGAVAMSAETQNNENSTSRKMAYQYNNPVAGKATIVIRKAEYKDPLTGKLKPYWQLFHYTFDASGNRSIPTIYHLDPLTKEPLQSNSNAGHISVKKLAGILNGTSKMSLTPEQLQVSTEMPDLTEEQSDNQPTERTVEQILQGIAQGTDSSAKIADILLKSIRKNIKDISVVYDPNADYSNYHWPSNLITLTGNSPKTKFHEAIHAITVRSMKSNETLDKYGQRLMKELEAKLIKDGKFTVAEIEESRTLDAKGLNAMLDRVKADSLDKQLLYAVRNKYEFLAQALASPEVQEYLKGIDFKRSTEVKSKNAFPMFINTLWDRVVNLIHKALGLKDGQWNLLAEAISFTTEAANTQVDDQILGMKAALKGKEYIPGKPVDTTSKNFKDWFGNSTVVDKDGKPLVMYHGTNKTFSEFSKDLIGSKTDDGWAGSGFYFHSDPETTAIYGKINMPVYLRLENPFDFEGKNFYTTVQEKGGPVEFSKWLRANGYDGAMLWGQRMVLDSNQIKSAVANTGEFSRGINNIYYDAIDSTLNDVVGESEKPTEAPENLDDLIKYEGNNITQREKYSSRVVKVVEGLGKIVQHFLQNSVYRIELISKAVSDRVNKMEAERNMANKKYLTLAEPFVIWYHSLSPELKAAIKIALLQPNTKDGIARKEAIYAKPEFQNINVGGLKTARELVSKIQEDIFIPLQEEALKRGLIDDKKLIDDYWHSKIKDIDGYIKFKIDHMKGKGQIEDTHDAVFQHVIQTKELEKGSPLTEEEKAQIITDLIRSGKLYSFRVPSSFKERITKGIHREAYQFYADPVETLLEHINEMNKTIAVEDMIGGGKRREAITKELNTLMDKIDNGSATDADKVRAGLLKERLTDKEYLIKNSVASILEQESRKLDTEKKEITEQLKDSSLSPAAKEKLTRRLSEISTQQQKPDSQIQSERQEVIELIRAIVNERGMSGASAKLKDLTLVMSLGNIGSTVTQLGDVVFPIFFGKSGNVPPAISKMMQSMGGKKLVDNFDLQKMYTDFSESGSMSKMLNTVLKYTGFTKMDVFGKELLLRTQQQMMSKMSEEEFIENYGKYYDDVEVIKEAHKAIKADKVEDNHAAKVILLIQLSKAQPIFTSSLPKGALEAGNARVFYMLKGFAIHALNNVAFEIQMAAKEGNQLQGKARYQRYAEGLGKAAGLAALLILAGATTDEIKDWATGKDKEFSDRIADNLFRLFLLNRFAMEKGIESGKPATAIAGAALMPPLRFYDNLATDAWNLMTLKPTFKTMQNLPLFGSQVFTNWTATGQFDKLKADRKYITELASRGDKEALITYVSEYNKNLREFKAKNRGKEYEELKPTGVAELLRRAKKREMKASM